MSLPAERRRHRRISVRLPLQLTVKDQTVDTHIVDLSESGIRLRTPASLPLMTRVQIALELPARKPSEGTSAVGMTGVIVRCVHVDDGSGVPYDTAIFFENLSDSARGRIERYMQTHTG